MVKKYLRRWGLTSVCLVTPSALISIMGFILWKVNVRMPAYVGFYHALCDCLLFITQPIALIILWLACKVHNLNLKLDRKLSQQKESKQVEPNMATAVIPVEATRFAHDPGQRLRQQHSVTVPNGLDQYAYSDSQPPVLIHTSMEMIPISIADKEAFPVNHFTCSPKRVNILSKSHSFSVTPSPAASVSYIQSEV